MASEPASRNPRGRPRVFSDDELRRSARYSYARRVRTRRGAQDLVYRRFAIAALELYSEAYPETAAELAWLFDPNPRHSLLSELGRVAQPRSNEQGELEWGAREVSRLVRAAFMISEAKPTTKVGIAMLRDLRRSYRAEAA